MTVPNWNLLNSLYKVTMKNTIGNLLLRFFKSEIISKLYSLTIISIRKTWIGDISLKTLWCYLLWWHLPLCVPNVFWNSSVHQWPYPEWPSIQNKRWKVLRKKVISGMKIQTLKITNFETNWFTELWKQTLKKRYNVIYNVESSSTLSMEITLDGRDWLTKRKLNKNFFS